MRIEKLDLLAYGPFRGLSLDLSAPGLHVVFGRNEAGKSTTLRAITGLLFGIEHTTQDAHVHKPADLRIGGTLLGMAGERVRVVRRKGHTNTLLDERGQPLDDGVVLRLLRGVSKQTFRLAFGIDHLTLGDGAKALLDGKGDLGESLFDASVGGGGDVQRLLAELTKEADEIWRPRGSALPLNEALKSFSEAQKSVRDKESRPEAHLTQQRELEATQAVRREKLREKNELSRRRAQLERAKSRVPLEGRRAALSTERAGLGAIAAHASAIASLAARIKDHELALDNQRKLSAELALAGARVEEAARRAGAVPDETRLDGPRVARIQRLVTERTGLELLMAEARKEIDRSERALETLRKEAPVPSSRLAPSSVEIVDSTALARALDHARSLGDLETRLFAERPKIGLKRRELEARAAALGGHSLAVAALVAARVPSIGDLEALGKRADAADRAVARTEERIADHDRESAALDRQIAEHSGEFTPPDASELRAARAVRDAAWAAIRDERDAAKRTALAPALERALHDADAVADRMLAEADRVTMLARLRANREHVATERAKAEADLGKHQAARAAIVAELRALFEPAGVTATSPEGMRVWLEKHAAIVDAHAALTEREHEVLHGQERLDDAKRELAAALGASNEERLTVLVADASQVIAAVEESRRSAIENARARAKHEEDLESRAAGLARDAAALGEVRAKLAELIAPLGVTDDASAEEITRALETTRDLFAARDARAKTEASLRAADAEIDGFAEEVTRLARRAAPDLASASALDAARGLELRRARVETLDREIEAAEARLAELGDEPIPEEVARLAADPEAASRAIEDLDASLEIIDEELHSLTHRIGGIESGIKAMRGDSNAADAAAQAQEALARVRMNAERWCRAKLAAVLLAREIERYREENQGPLLGRASALFARLTLGEFTGIRAGFDDRDRPALRLVRAAGAEIDVTALSAGTRDQLYLSLRLASLLRYAEIAEPMPLVMDDVFVHFDDERSAAALGVLAEVSQTVQVLFFTHHARLVELARTSVPAGELVVHELSTERHARSAAPTVGFAG